MIIQSILDNDLYKFTMQQAVCVKYPKDYVTYKFINRSNVKFPQDFDKALRKEILEMSNELYLKKDEKEFLKERCYYFTPVYIDFLEGYKFDPNEVFIEQNGDKLEVEITGPYYRTILWEVPLLAIISELYYKMTNATFIQENEIRQKTKEKFQAIEKLRVKLAEFGTRRRASFDVHNIVLDELNSCDTSRKCLVGTSNVLLAKKHNLTPIGTQAHEYYSFHAARYGYRFANEMSMKSWLEVYKGELGIVLPDTFTRKIFLRSFTSEYAKLFDGIRQDSGNPNDFTDDFVNHYKKLKIDPSTKNIIYSNALSSIEACQNVVRHCDNRMRVSLAIGTLLTNDVGVSPLSIVIKLVAAKPEGYSKFIQTCKLSDDTGKYTGDETEVKRAIQELEIGE